MLNWFMARMFYLKGFSSDSERNKSLRLLPHKAMPSAPARELKGSYVLPAEGNDATASGVISKIEDITSNGSTVTSRQTLSPAYKDALWREPAFSEAPFPYLKNWCRATNKQSDCLHLVSELQQDFSFRNATQSTLDSASAQPLEVLYAQCQRNIGILRSAPTLDKSGTQKEKVCREHVLKLAEILKPS